MVKLQTIKDNKYDAYIVAAELAEQESLKIESILISVLYKFNNADLNNLVSGQHEFEIKNVHNIDFKYSKPIELEDFAKEINAKY